LSEPRFARLEDWQDCIPCCKLSEPEFLEFSVLYNGRDEFPDFKELRLSDSFKTKGKGNLELVANVYNINKGRNAEIANKSPVLNGYNELIAEVNKTQRFSVFQATNTTQVNLFDAIRVNTFAVVSHIHIVGFTGIILCTPPIATVADTSVIVI